MESLEPNSNTNSTSSLCVKLLTCSRRSSQTGNSFCFRFSDHFSSKIPQQTFIFSPPASVVRPSGQKSPNIPLRVRLPSLRCGRTPSCHPPAFKELRVGSAARAHAASLRQSQRRLLSHPSLRFWVTAGPEPPLRAGKVQLKLSIIVTVGGSNNAQIRLPEVIGNA